MTRVRWVVAAAAAALAVAAPAAMADSGTTIYRSTVLPLPGNLPSAAFQATQLSEFGDEVTFAHRARRLRTVTVTMSSWGCQQGAWFSGDCFTHHDATFAWPITLNLYNASTTAQSTTPVQPGTPIASVTKTFRIPFRPSASPKCTGADVGKWFRNGQCFNGFANNITFNFSSLHLKLPNNIVWGIAFNTSNYGPEPIGTQPCDSTAAGCPYDSLNLALAPSVKVGSKPFPDTVFQNTITPGNLCDGGTVALTGVFNLDSPTNACWAGYVPAARFVATS
jgi:hypothetical protein